MGNRQQSKPAQQQSHDYRTQQENLQLTEDEWRRILRKGGMRAVWAKKRELINAWKKQPVLIAIIGQTGSGKSTLIRRLLGYQPTDDCEPVVGSSVNECTKEAKEYPKKGTGLVYIDLPGVGSTSTQCAFSTPEDQERYCDRFHLRTIDYFILVSQNKFNQQENMLAEYITKTLKKNFIFVQTKIDTLRDEFGNQRVEEVEGFDAVKNRIRTDIQKQLGRQSTEKIFLVSNHALRVGLAGEQRWVYDNSSDYEFDLLVKQIQDDMLGGGGLTALKGEAFILATGAISESAIRGIANTLRNQSWGWATLSGLLGAVPIPGVSVVCDASIIITQAIDYFATFGLNPAQYMGDGNAVEKVKKLIEIMGTSMGARVAALLVTVAGLTAVEEGTKAVPVVGTIIGCVLGTGISFASTCTILRQIINFCEIEALKVLQQS